MPLVSVVMSSYNHEKFVSEAIESVLRQGFDDFELIIVDDGSTDRSVDIIERHATDDRRIRVVLHEQNLGIARTVNDGIRRACGEYLGFIASDDAWMEDKLSKQLAVLEFNGDLIVCAQVEIIDESGQPLDSTEERVDCLPQESGDVFDEILFCGQLFAETALFKRKNLGNIMLDEHLKYLSDWKFCLDLAAEHEFYCIPEPLAQYRMHANNTLGFKEFQGHEKRLLYREEILVRNYALKKYPHRMSAEARTVALENLSYYYWALGENGKALTSFVQAVTNRPFWSSDLRHPRRLLQFALSKSPREILKRE